MAVCEFGYVDIHQPPVIGVAIDDFTRGARQFAKTLSVEAPEQRLQLRLGLRHFGRIAFHEADVEGFLGGVVVVYVADGDAGLAGNVANGSSEIALPDKQPERHFFDRDLVPANHAILQPGHQPLKRTIVRLSKPYVLAPRLSIPPRRLVLTLAGCMMALVIPRSLNMRFCRFGEGRLGLVEGTTVRDVTAALDVLPAARYPLPTHDVF